MERAAPEGETGVFGDESKAVSSVPTVGLKTLHAKIGELTLMKEVGIEAIYRQPTPLNRQLDTKSISICCANWRSPAPIRSGPLANPISVAGYA